MTVRELITKLQECPQGATVVIMDGASLEDVGRLHSVVNGRDHDELNSNAVYLRTEDR